MINKQYSHINACYIFELGDNDTDFVKDIVEDVLVVVPENMQKMAEAIGANNTGDATFLAHKLKGTFRFVGNNKLGDIMERIENEALHMEEIMQLMNAAEEEYQHAEKEFRDFLNSIKA